MIPAFLGQFLNTPEALAVILILASVLALLIGYRWGKRLGLDEGERRGWTQAPVELHRRALVSGLCPTCGTRARGPAGQSDRREGEEGLPSRSSF